jgi:predicted DNA-binding transcriptional regulator YafY
MYRRRDVGVVTRALRILEALRGFKLGRRISEVAAEVGASERTVRRDLAELQDAGFEIEISNREHRSYACLHSEQAYSAVPITKRERFTLLAVRSVFEVLHGTPFLEDVGAVMQKLEQRMSAKERIERDAFGERFMYMPDHGTKSYAGKEDIIDAIQTGIISRKIVGYRYADAQKRAQQGFMAPLGMVLYRNGLYALGARMKQPDGDVLISAVRWFAVERFTDAEHLRAQKFEIPPEFDMRKFMHGAFGPHLADDSGPHDVVVEFSREKAHLVASRTWHPSQKLEQLDDGRLRLAFQVPSLAPVVSWVLEWGPHAQAIAPAALVHDVVDELDRARSLYTRPMST